MSLPILYHCACTHMWICPQMSLWKSSFVTKQSHLDSSGKRCSHMLSHRLRVTKSPSGSAGHVGHMSSCGCLGFSALHTNTNAHCTHTHNTALHTRTTLHVTHLYEMSQSLHLSGGLLSGGLVSGFSQFSVLPARQKPRVKAHLPSWRVVVYLKPRNLLLYVQEHEGKNVKRKRKKSVIGGLIALIGISKHTQNLDSKWKPQFNLYIFP